MGFGAVSLGSLLLILIIVLVIFGGERLRNIGSDLRAAAQSFRKSAADRPSKKSRAKK